MKRPLNCWLTAFILALLLTPAAAAVSVPVDGGSLTIDTSSGTGKVTRCDSSVTSAVIPADVGGIPVTELGSGAFNGCSALTTVNIPYGVTKIGAIAFQGCNHLTSVNIPGSVASIGFAAFNGCTSLPGVTIPDSVTSIAACAFSTCWNLTSVNLPAGITSLGDELFSNCQKLTSIIIPEGVASIGEEVFKGCSRLESVTIPASVTSIGNDAFNGCSSLRNVYYGGTEAQWNSLMGGSLPGVTIHCNTPSSSGSGSSLPNTASPDAAPIHAALFLTLALLALLAGKLGRRKD